MTLKATIEEAKALRTRYAYNSPAAVTRTRVAGFSKPFFAYRFFLNCKVGDILKNEDGSDAVVCAIV